MFYAIFFSSFFVKRAERTIFSLPSAKKNLRQLEILFSARETHAKIFWYAFLRQDSLELEYPLSSESN